MKIGDRCFVHGYIDEIRKDTVIIRNNGGYFGTIPSEVITGELSSAQPEVIRCKDCKWWGYDDDDGKVRVCHAAKHEHMSPNWSIMIYRTYKEDFYCAFAERRTE